METPLPPPAQDSERAKLPTWVWPALAVVVATLAMHGVFTLTRVFFVRDLGFFWWPEHVWALRTVASGELPLWDPYVGFGQSAISDPIRHLLFFPTLPFRLIFSDVVGFNLSVALPFPLAALGTCLFLRRHETSVAASFGGIVFALSGPMMSSGVMLTNAWSQACLPWELWAVDGLWERVDGRRVATLALVVAVQVLAGEPVSLAASAAVVAAYALAVRPLRGAASPRLRVTVVAATAAAGILGLALAAAQAFPLVDAVSRSERSLGIVNTGWALHPASLVEALLRPLFGDFYGPWQAQSPWLRGLNGGRLPYINSVYLGAASRRRGWALFWIAVAGLATVCALGDHTPVYPWIQRLVPLTRSFRYPSKYIVVAAFAAAVLAARGLSALLERRESLRRATWGIGGVTAAVGLAAGALLALVAFAPGDAARLFAPFATAAGAPNADVAATALVESAREALPRLVVVAIGTVGCLILAGRERLGEGRRLGLAVTGLFALVALDLFTMHAGLNPTIEAEAVSAPPWRSALEGRSPGRIYVGGRSEWASPVGGNDAPPERADLAPPETSLATVTSVYQAVLASFPSAWGLREAVSIDLTNLWSREYHFMVGRFAAATAEERTRYLQRVGVRYFLTPAPPADVGPPLAELSAFAPTALFEVPGAFPRAYLVRDAIVDPQPNRQTERLFGAGFDSASAVMLVADPPPPSGAPGAPAGPTASVVDETSTTVTVRAAAPADGGFLVLLDSYDPNWDVEVDGSAATLLRANGLFRAVHIAAGEHEVRFSYRPVPLYWGLVVSGLAAVLLVAAWILARRATKVDPTVALGDE
jgi:hypothetical protein